MGAGKRNTVKLKKLIEKIHFQKIIGSSDLDIKGLTYDSRKAKKSFLFVAISGFKMDGHRFIRHAWEKGARAFIIEKDIV